MIKMKNHAYYQIITRVLIFAFLAFLFLTQIFPLIWVFSYSIKKSGDLFGPELLSFPKEPQWINFYKAFIFGKMPLYLANSLLVVIPSVCIGTLLSFCLAYACTRMEWKLKKIVWAIVVIGLTIPVHTTLLPNFLWYKVLHRIDTHFALIISYAAFTMAFNTIVFSGFLAGIPKSMEESAIIEGVGYFSILAKIIAPLSGSGFITVGIMTFMSHWNDFIIANTYISSESKRTLPFSVFLFSGQYSSDYAVQFAVMALLALPPLIFYFIFNKWMLAGITAGAVKG